ncbi:MAG: carbohydrate porin [Pseudomonadota bacterium]
MTSSFAFFARLIPATLLASPVAALAQDKPWRLDAVYTAEVWSVVDGGISDDARYLDNVDLTLAVDLEDAAGWNGASLWLYGLYNNGNVLTNAAGDYQTASNIEAPVEAARLYEAWIEQDFGGGASFKFGLYDLNSEFDVLESADVFIQSAHGVGTVLGFSGRNGPSIFPITSLGARVQYIHDSGWAARIAIFDGVPGNPDDLDDTAILLGGGDGALMVAELEAPLLDGKLLFGHWRYTAEFEDFDGRAGDGNKGWYIRGEHQLWRSAAYSERSLAGFFRYGQGDRRFNPFNHFMGAGLTLTGPIKARSKDILGIAFAAAFTSTDFQNARRVERAEWNIELTYSARLTDWLRAQPNVQYILNPSADPGIKNALAIGLRIELGWQL